MFPHHGPLILRLRSSGSPLPTTAPALILRSTTHAVCCWATAARGRSCLRSRALRGHTRTWARSTCLPTRSPSVTRQVLAGAAEGRSVQAAWGGPQGDTHPLVPLPSATRSAPAYPLCMHIAIASRACLSFHRPPMRLASAEQPLRLFHLNHFLAS